MPASAAPNSASGRASEFTSTRPTCSTPDDRNRAAARRARAWRSTAVNPVSRAPTITRSGAPSDTISSNIEMFMRPALSHSAGVGAVAGEVSAMQIRGSIAVVTGASSGIGAATARLLAERGATVIAVARRKDRLDDVVEQCRRSSTESIAAPGDVSDRAFAEDVVRDAQQRFGGVDVVVNNAGISPGENPAAHAADDAERIMAVNFFGAVYVAGAALPGMLDRRRGSIVNVTSVSGYVPAPGEPAYGASKAALSRWSHGLAIDLHGTGVHVGVVSPGPIDTEIWQHTGTEYKGKLYSPDVVGQGVVRAIERRLTHVTVPRRFGAVSAMYPMVGRPMRWGIRKYGDR